MTKTISSSLIKDTKGILALCQDSQNPIIVQTNGTPVLVLMDAAAFEYQFKDSRKLPDILKRISQRRLIPATRQMNQFTFSGITGTNWSS